MFHVTPPPAPSAGSTLGKTGAPENLITGLALVDNLHYRATTSRR